MRRIALFLSIAFITFLCLMFAGHRLFKPSSLDKVEILDDGWNVRYNGVQYSDVRLSELRELIGSGTHKGDTIVLSRTINDPRSLTAPTLLFETRFSGFRFNCGGIKLFEYSMSPESQNKFLGCENIYATLPPISGTTSIDIELLVSQDGAYSYFEPMIFGSYSDVLLYVIYTHMFVFITSVFLIIFGLLFFTIAIGFRHVLPEFNMQIYSSLLFITLGVWFLAQFRILNLFIDTRGHQTEVEYIALYLTVPIMYMVIGSVHNYLRNATFFTVAWVSSLAALTPIALHYTGIIYMNKALPLFQINGLILFIYAISLLIRDSKKGLLNSSQYIQLIGQLMLAASFFFNVFFYYLERLGINEQIMLSKKAVPMGTLCMVFATLVNYCVYISESYARKKEYESLAHLAYADGLTNLPNRSRYEKYLADLADSDDDYCVISIDLNGLKGVNDNQGHLMGDKYLKEFSTALSSCFSGHGFVARIGGDEFVAILKGNELNNAETCINSLDASLDSLNRSESSIKRSAATGFAFRHEVFNESQNAVYLLADERMYAKKAAMHAAL